MNDADQYANDEANGVNRVVITASSGLYDHLKSTNGVYKLSVTLESDVSCPPNSDEVECKVEVLRVVRIDDVYYEYVERACVQLSFYEGKLVQPRNSEFKGKFCANKELTVAREACCVQENFRQVWTNAVLAQNITHFYDGERMKWSTAKERCIEYGRDLCFWNRADFQPQTRNADDARIDQWKHNYQWTSEDCSINLKIRPEDGYVALVHNVTSKSTDKPK